MDIHLLDRVPCEPHNNNEDKETDDDDDDDESNDDDDDDADGDKVMGKLNIVLLLAI